MKVTRAASIPLVTHDPYFSIWSGADHLYDKDPVHWSQIRQQLRGYVNVDGVVYSFLGDKEFHETIGQTGVDVTATSTTYTFENEKIILNVKFTSPLLLDDLTLVSRPCTYIDYAVEKKENCDVRNCRKIKCTIRTHVLHSSMIHLARLLQYQFCSSFHHLLLNQSGMYFCQQHISLPDLWP